MFKTRTGLVVDFGKSLPLGTYNGTGSYSTVGKCPAFSDRILLALYNTSPKTFTQGPPPTVLKSSESFWSTDFKRPSWNECWHEKTNNFLSFPYGFCKKPLPTYAAAYTHCSRLTWSYLNTPGLAKRLEASDFTRARAYASMVPRFESDFKTLNFLFELKDFRDIGGQLRQILRPGGDLLRYLRNLKYGEFSPTSITQYRSRPNRTCGEVLNGIADSIAGSWLSYTLAYIPTIKDFAALSAALLTESNAALNKFKEDGLQEQSSHYSEVLFDDSATTSNSNFPTGRYIRKNKCVFTATMGYSYTYGLTSVREAFMKYWGLTGTAEEFWNCLPFSFLVDYLFQVGKALHYTDVDNNLDLSVLRYCESYLSTNGYFSEVKLDPATTCSLIVDGELIDHDKWVPVMGVYNSFFTRRLGNPLKGGLIVPKLRLPSTPQLGNVAALVKLLFF